MQPDESHPRALVSVYFLFSYCEKAVKEILVKLYFKFFLFGKYIPFGAISLFYLTNHKQNEKIFSYVSWILHV